MFTLLFRYIIPLVVLVTAGILGYNYFYGTPEEQENTKQIISQVKGLGTDIYELLASEADKFQEGKYDDAIDKIGAGLSSLKDQLGAMADQGGDWVQQLNELEAERAELQQQLNRMKESSGGVAEGPGDGARSNAAAEQISEQEIQDRIKQLARKTEELGTKISGN